jgi:putative oxidoreductase
MADIDRSRAYGITILRVVVGVIFFAHGYMKFFVMGVDGVTGFFGSLGIPAPGVMAALVTTLELGGSIALIIGLFTQPLALAFVADMVGAITFAKKTLTIMAPKGIELELLLLTACVALIILGPGALAVDDLLPWRRRKVQQATSTPAPAS